MQVLMNVDNFNVSTIEMLYNIFEDEFIKNTIYLSNNTISYEINVKIKNVCNCPFGNSNKQERFWHIITKEENQRNKQNNPCPSPENRRTYDSARAKRIHWIKLIIQNWLNDNDIVYFYEKIKGKNTLHIWHTKKDFIVILRKESNSSDRFLVTTYLIYRNQRQRYKKRLKEYEKNKPNGLEWF